jgi:apolipoprotein N-acyltransferase
LLSFPAFILMWNWLLTKSDLNYPWTDLGYALSYLTTLIQAADIAGIYLITMFILIINILVYLSISSLFTSSKSMKRGYIYISLIIIMAFYVYGGIRVSQLKDDPSKSLTIGLIQGNITKDVKWAPGNLQFSFDTYHGLSRQAVRESAQLVIWPETAIPAYLLQEPSSMGLMRRIIDDLKIPVLTGTVFYETVGPREYVYFNSAILLNPDNDDYQLYSKMHLVPVSEKIPFSERYKILRDIHLGQADFSSGREQTVFNLNGTKFGTLICFESAFPGFANDYARMGAEFLVIITNDMWFGRTSLFEQHAMMAVFRAIENRIPVVRAGNTGISLAVDKRGKLLAKSDVFEKEYIMAKIHPEKSTSAYNVVGDIIPQAATLVSLLALAVAIWKRKGYIERQYDE